MNRCEEFGSLYRKFRLRLDQGLREYCDKNGLDPIFLSKLERGGINFFKYSKDNDNIPLISHIEFLKLEGDEKNKFISCFKECKGEEEKEITEEELLGRVPLLVKNKNGEKFSEEELDILFSLLEEVD